MASKAEIGRLLKDALMECHVVGSEVYYPAAWRFRGDTATANTSSPIMRRAPRVACLHVAAEHVTRSLSGGEAEWVEPVDGGAETISSVINRIALIVSR